MTGVLLNLSQGRRRHETFSNTLKPKKKNSKTILSGYFGKPGQSKETSSKIFNNIEIKLFISH